MGTFANTGHAYIYIEPNAKIIKYAENKLNMEGRIEGGHSGLIRPRVKAQAPACSPNRGYGGTCSTINFDGNYDFLLYI